MDASALIAYLRKEPGGERVAEAMADGLVMSSVNLSEVLSKLAEAGAQPDQALEAMVERGIVGGTVTIDDFTQADALSVARLRPLTRHVGLSLGDRACFALAGRLGLSALTADRTWIDLDIGVVVELIR